VLNALSQLASLVVPGCREATIDLIDDSGPSHRLPSRPIGDAVRLPLLSGPMDEDGELVGVLNLLGDRPFGGDVAEPAARLARLAATIVVVHRAAQRRERQLQEALRSRDVIGQAKGVLIAQSGVDEATAFLMLVRASQRENRKLRDLAADIGECRGRLPRAVQ
jgi:hypothetical protein